MEKIDINLVEFLGYVSMVVVLISMTMKDINNLRILNSIACGMFIVYGFILSAYPIVLMNILVIIINVYSLIKNKKIYNIKK